MSDAPVKEWSILFTGHHGTVRKVPLDALRDLSDGVQRAASNLRHGVEMLASLCHQKEEIERKHEAAVSRVRVLRNELEDALDQLRAETTR